MKKRWLVAVFLMLCLTPNAYSQQSEDAENMEGFRGLSWGTPLKEIQNQMIECNEIDGKILFCVRENEDMNIGGASLASLQYVFYDEKLSGALITTEGSSNWTALKEATIAKFGSLTQPNEFIERYLWSEGDTFLIIEYNEFVGEGSMYLYSIKMMKIKEEQDKKAAEEGKTDW